MKKQLLFLLFGVSAFSSYSQKVVWEKTIGGEHSEYLFDMVPTLDYGFLLAGSSLSDKSGLKSLKSQGNLDYFLWKMDKNGEEEWQLSFGGEGQDILKSIYPTADMGYILGGYSDSGKINYIYDAAGMRLSKKVQPTGGTLVTTDYVNGFQYENNVLQFLPHAEGYVKRNANNTYLYAYQYKDHLGNIRLSYADVNGNGTIQPASEILEENNYYPFGLKHKGYNEIANSNRSEVAEKYKFLGQERQEELGLNWDVFKYRSYDYTIGRFMCIDPISEEYRYITPYQFASNNPIWHIELEGLEGIKFQEVDNNGKFLRHVVQLKVAVLTVKSADRTLKSSDIKDRVSSTFQYSDVKKISESLNKTYNGDNGTGSMNSKGETVFFKFNVQELNVGEKENINRSQLTQIGVNSGVESGEV